MTRSEAYFSALKYYFADSIVRGVDRREAWRTARNFAATYIFHIATRHLTAWRVPGGVR